MVYAPLPPLPLSPILHDAYETDRQTDRQRCLSVISARRPFSLLWPKRKKKDDESEKQNRTKMILLQILPPTRQGENKTRNMHVVDE